MVRPVLTGQNPATPGPLHLILASASPRRAELIQQLDLAATIAPSRLDEDLLQLPADVAERVRGLALAKATAVFRRGAGALVLGADTLVALGDAALGQPGTSAAAIAMLHRLAGRTHAVHTGLALLMAGPAPAETTSVTAPGDASPALHGLRVTPIDGGHALTAVITSLVSFHRLTAEQITAYVATGEPLDKAGAYAIQGLGGRLVAGLDGCFTNVVGLPLCAVAALLSLATGRPVRCPDETRCRPAGPGCWCDGAIP